MNHEAFKFNFVMDEEWITVMWERLPAFSALAAGSRYPELEFRFNYRDISADTVRAMLRDMRVPDSFARAIMTRIEEGES